MEHHVGDLVMHYDGSLGQIIKLYTYTYDIYWFNKDIPTTDWCETDIIVMKKILKKYREDECII